MSDTINIAHKFRGLNSKECHPSSFFLSFEGIEGSGKSSLIKAFQSYLQEQGITVLVLREPGGTVFGEGLRQAILSSTQELSPLAEAHLFCSARAQLLFQKILPQLKNPKTVVMLDRYLHSSLSYQGMARGLGMPTVLELHQHWPLCLLPHQTFYLEVSARTSAERVKLRNQKKDYFEARPSAFTLQLIEGYRQSGHYFPKTWCPLDGEQSPSQVLHQLIQQWEKTHHA